MAIAAPKHSALQTAPGPSRTAPPEPKKRPRDRPRPGGTGRSSATAPEALRKEGAPKRKSGRKAAGDSPIRKAKAAATATPARKAPRKVSTDAPARKAAPKRKKAPTARAATAAPARKAAPRKASTAAPARKPSRNGLLTAPSRHKAAPRRRARVLPTAGRAAVAVTQLPESGLIHRLTRGRAWIGLLGVLLVGIVALNVVTLSFAATNGKVEAVNAELSKKTRFCRGSRRRSTARDGCAWRRRSSASRCRPKAMPSRS